MTTSLALVEQNQPLDLSRACPISNFVQEALNGICHPIANYFYQMIRPQNLLDLYYGVAIVDKKVPTYQDYQEAVIKLKTVFSAKSIFEYCQDFFKNETVGTAGAGKAIPPIDRSKNIQLIFCLQPKTLRKFMLAFNRALGLISKIVSQGLRNVDEIEKEFKIFFSALEIGNEYRQKGVIVSEIDLSDKKVFDAYVLKMGFTPKMIERSVELVDQAYAESKRIYGNEAYPQYSDEYKALMKDIMYFPPKFTQIPLLIKDFFKNLVNRFEEIYRFGVTDQNSLIAFAAWVHQELIKLHPFDDGNGRSARIFMNAILKFFDIAPVVFLNDSEYLEAVKKDIKKPGAFADYLIQVAIPETQNNPGLLSWANQESIIKRVKDAMIASRAKQIK